MGKKITFYIDPEDRHWNTNMKDALLNDLPPIRDGERCFFLHHKDKTIEWQDMANHCVCCMERLSFNEEFDSVYCKSCDSWREDTCDDSSCEYCKIRPLKPSMCPDWQE